MLVSKCCRGFMNVLSYLSETYTRAAIKDTLLVFKNLTFTYKCINVISAGHK